MNTTLDILKASASEVLPALQLPDEILHKADEALVELCRAQAPLLLKKAVIASFQLPAKKKRKTAMSPSDLATPEPDASSLPTATPSPAA